MDDPTPDLGRAENGAIIRAFLAMLLLLAVAAGLTWLAIVQAVPIAAMVAFILAISGVVIYARTRIRVAVARFERARAARLRPD